MHVRRRTLLQLLGSSLATAGWAAQGIGRVGGVLPRDYGNVPATSPPEAGARSLDVGWHFHVGDVPLKPLRGHQESYLAAKAGGARGAAAANFDDGSWRVVDLPHDWAIESPPSETENLAQGYRKRGIAWYRRDIALDPALEGRLLEIRFGAIATNATIWFNGTPVAHNWSGYNGIGIDISAMATFGSRVNRLAVRVDADAAEGWWYEGAGIYRDVWLVDRAPVSIVTDGVHAVPAQDPDGTWRLAVDVTIYSIEKAGASVTVEVDLIDPDGDLVGRASGSVDALPLVQGDAKVEIAGIKPRLWSPEIPSLYAVHVRLIRDGKPIDERAVSCGFRTLRFDAQKGFFLNEVRTQIKGVCLHPDHAGVGVAVPPALIEWRVRQLKALGCNAVRCSHGAPDTALLDACDRHGIMVMNENRNFNISPDYIEQLEWLVRRDRNRACVILWSVFNEEPMQGTSAGFEMVRRAVAAVKALDGTRPVTAAMNSGMFSPVNVSQAVDVVGFNYQHSAYDRFHAKFPQIPMMSSEDTSAFMTRGEWNADAARRIAPSDDSAAAQWGLSHREAWKAIATRPFLAGGFVWTGFDYHGEPTPYTWPANSSYFGILDLCGFPKAAAYLHRAMWIRDRPLLDILPHWNWPGREGQPIKVMLATNVDRVELLCNGRSVGEGKADPYDMISFNVLYEAGRLEARGWKDGELVATARVETTGEPHRLRLTPDRSALSGDGVDAQPVTIDVLDARGRPVPTANLDVNLTVDGGRVIGVGNGDPTSLAPSKGLRVRLFNGLAQVIVQSERAGVGTLRLTAAAGGLKPALAAIAIRSGSVPHALPPPFQQSIVLWRQSPITVDRPATVVQLGDNDMNSWDPVEAGERSSSPVTPGFVVLAARVTLGDAVRRPGAVLHFERIAGQGDILINGAVVATKGDPAATPLDVLLPRGDGVFDVSLILDAVPGKPLGLPGAVFVRAPPLH